MPDSFFIIIFLLIIFFAFWIWIEIKKLKRNGVNIVWRLREPFREVIPQYRPSYSDLLPEQYVVFDLETSGLDPAKYEILEIGAIRFENGQETGRYHSYIKPRFSIPRSATEINGITKFTVRAAPSFNEAADDFLAFIGDLPLVAHNARFDMHFLQTELGRRIDNDVIDTLRLSRELIPDLENHKLETLKYYFGMNVESHNALDDCLVTAKVYQECAPLAKERWLQSRPLIDKTIPDDSDRLDEQAQTYYQVIQEILRSNSKSAEDTHVVLFKNGKDFAVNIGDCRLLKIVFYKKETCIAMDCTKSDIREILDVNAFQYRQDAGSGIYKIVLSDPKAVKSLAPIICRRFDEVRINFQ